MFLIPIPPQAGASQNLYPDEIGSRVYCPICVANGYASTTRSSTKKWFFTANSVGGALWTSSIPRLQLGVGYHGSSRAVRALASYRLVPEEHGNVGVNVGYGIQSQETGASGFSTTFELNPNIGRGSLNLFGGASLQSDESRLRPVGGFKWSPDGTWVVGNQYDGRAQNPFVQYLFGNSSVGLLYVAARRLTLTGGISF